MLRQKNDLAAPASRRSGWSLALVLLSWLLMGCLLVQSPATVALTRAAPPGNFPSEEERPTETTETPAVHLSVAQGRRHGRSVPTPPPALRMPLLCASGCLAARHRDGGRMLVCDVRLGTGLPLRL